MKASKRTVMKAKAAEAGMTPREYKKLLQRIRKKKKRAERDT